MGQWHPAFSFDGPLHPSCLGSEHSKWMSCSNSHNILKCVLLNDTNVLENDGGHITTGLLIKINDVRNRGLGSGEDVVEVLLLHKNVFESQMCTVNECCH